MIIEVFYYDEAICPHMQGLGKRDAECRIGLE
jgi:hypothetical protein